MPLAFAADLAYVKYRLGGKSLTTRARDNALFRAQSVLVSCACYVAIICARIVPIRSGKQFIRNELLYCNVSGSVAISRVTTGNPCRRGVNKE
jgi:hypothetical protein